MRKIHSRLEIIKHKNHGKDTYLVQGLVNGAKLYLNPYFLKVTSTYVPGRPEN